VGIIASKVGRKKTVLCGVAMLALAFFIGVFVTPTTPPALMYPIFILAGIGWATINVNSFPMAIELAKKGDIGKYTGYYYTASMAAQILAPFSRVFCMTSLVCATPSSPSVPSLLYCPISPCRLSSTGTVFP
jgi:MFS family permease